MGEKDASTKIQGMHESTKIGERVLSDKLSDISIDEEDGRKQSHDLDKLEVKTEQVKNQAQTNYNRQISDIRPFSEITGQSFKADESFKKPEVPTKQEQVDPFQAQNDPFSQ